MKNVDQEYVSVMSHDDLNTFMDKGENAMLNMTHNPQTQHDAPPYIFQSSWAREPETYVIHHLRDVVPQDNDTSAVLRNKETLLSYLRDHIWSVQRTVRKHEEMQVLTKLVAALDDDQTFERLLAEENFNLCYVDSNIVTGVLPQPQTDVVAVLDKERWTATITTLQRLQERSREGRYGYQTVNKHIQTVKEQYQQLFDALCYLEHQGEFPVDINTIDAKKIVQRKTHEHLKSQPKKTAEELLSCLENAQRGLKLTEVIDVTQNAKSHVTKLLLMLEAQDKVYKDTPSGERGNTFYAVSLATLKEKRLPFAVDTAIKRRLLQQGKVQLLMTPNQAFQVLSHDGQGVFTRKDIERVLTHDYTTVLFREDLRQILRALENGGQIVSWNVDYWGEEGEYYLNTPEGKAVLRRNIAAAHGTYIQRGLEACLQRLEQEPSAHRKDGDTCLSKDGLMEVETPYGVTAHHGEKCLE